MLKSLSLNAGSLPVSGLDYEDIQEQSTRLEGARASGRTVFRESYLNSAVMEAAISSQVAEYMEWHPEASAQYDQSAARHDWRGGQAKVRREDFVPRYSSEELSGMGYTVPEGFEFEADGKMSLQRFAAYSQAYEDNEADAITVAAMPDGVLSVAASLGGGLVAGIADPINLIPFGAGISRAKQAFNAGRITRAGFLGRVAAAGAVEGAVGAAAVDAISFPKANEWGADLGLEDALTDIAVSGLFGSLFGSLGGGLEMHSYRMAERHVEALQRAVSDMENGMAPGVEAALQPMFDEARVRLDERMADPEYLRGLLDQEQRTTFQDVDAFRRMLADFDEGKFRESGKFSTAPSGPDGPRLVLGEMPAAFRMLDGFGWMEMSPDLVRRIRLEEEWNGIDLAELPQALARPAAVFDMGEGRRAALITLPDGDGGVKAALAEMRPGTREFYGQTRKSRPTDAFSEIDDINLISGKDLSTVGLARRIVGEGKALYADASKLAEIGGVSRELTDAAIYARPEVKTPDSLNRHLAMEDAGIDLDAGPVFERTIDLQSEAAEIKAQGEALAARAGGDPAADLSAREMEAQLAEQRLEEMAARGELTEEEIDFLQNGSRGEGEDGIMGQRQETESVTAAQALVDGTECVIERSLNVLS